MDNVHTCKQHTCEALNAINKNRIKIDYVIETLSLSKKYKKIA